MTAPTQTRVVIEAETFIVTLPDGRTARVLRLHFDNCPHCWEVGADRMLLSDDEGFRLEDDAGLCWRSHAYHQMSQMP